MKTERGNRSSQSKLAVFNTKFSLLRKGVVEVLSCEFSVVSFQLSVSKNPSVFPAENSGKSTSPLEKREELLSVRF